MDQTFPSNIFWLSRALEFKIQMTKCTIWKKQEIGERLAEVCIYQKHQKEGNVPKEFNSGVPKAAGFWGTAKHLDSVWPTPQTHCETLEKWQILRFSTPLSILNHNEPSLLNNLMTLKSSRLDLCEFQLEPGRTIYLSDSILVDIDLHLRNLEQSTLQYQRGHWNYFFSCTKWF